MSKLNHSEVELTKIACYGTTPKGLTVSWSRLQDWLACKQRVKLIHQRKRSSLFPARNVLAGKVTDLVMREALEAAPKDPSGRLLELKRSSLFDLLPDIWDKSVTNLESNSILKWNTPNPKDDQKKILGSVHQALEVLHPMLENTLLGKRFIPEYRPDVMPAIGIPGPNGETVYIRLFVAVDLLVQIEEDKDNPNGLGKWGIYDLKTTSNSDYLTQTLPQLVFYDIGLEAQIGRNRVHDWGLIAPLVSNKIQRIEVTSEERLKVLTWIVSYVHGVWAGEEDFTQDDSNCFGCVTRHACPKAVGPISKDEQGLPLVRLTGEPGLMQ